MKTPGFGMAAFHTLILVFYERPGGREDEVWLGEENATDLMLVSCYQ